MGYGKKEPQTIKIETAGVEGLRQDVDELSASLAEKATKTEIATKTEKTYVDTELGKKLDKTGTISVSQINKNAGLIDQTYLTDELKQQIAGTTPVNAIPADNSITTKKLAFNPVIGVLGKNLFNKNDIVPEKYLDGANGSEINFTGFFVSSFIKIAASTAYALAPKAGTTRIWFYDTNKAYISKVDNVNTFSTPTNAVYLRVASDNTFLNTLQLEIGSTNTTFEDYQVKVDPITLPVLPVDGEKINNKSISLSKLKDVVYSKNLFNKQQAILGSYIIWSTGLVGGNANYFASDFIEVTPSTQYVRTYSDQMAFYTSDKSFISGLHSGNPKEFTTPSNCKYIRISAPKTYLETYQLELGSASTAYEDFYLTIPNLKVNGTSLKTIKSITSQIVLSATSKKIKLLGDSITAGLGGTGFAESGSLIMQLGATDWSVNTNGHCWANSLKTYFLSKFNCEVINYGCSGANSNHLVQGLSQLIDGTEDIVICMIGTNDRSNNTKQQFYNNLISIYNYCNDRGIDFIFMSNVPASVTRETEAGQNYHMEDVDSIIMKAAADTNTEYISVYKLFNEYCQNRGITIDSLLGDGLHPNNAGYDVMFYLISNALGIGTKRDGATW